jgi:hypothetical protein
MTNINKNILLLSNILEYYGKDEVMKYYNETNDVIHDWLFNFTLDKGNIYIKSKDNLDIKDINKNKKLLKLKIPWKELTIQERVETLDTYTKIKKVENEHLNYIKQSLLKGKLCSNYIKYDDTCYIITLIKKKKEEKNRLSNNTINDLILKNIVKYKNNKINEKIINEIYKKITLEINLKLNSFETEKIKESINLIANISNNSFHKST